MIFKLPLYLLVLASLLMNLSLANAADKPKFKSYQVKAVYVFRIANFVHWKNEADMQTLRFCVEGNEQVKQTLSGLLVGKEIRGLALQVSNELNANCDIAFISAIDSVSPLAKYGPSTLTIGDNANFTSLGGAIQLQTKGKRIKPLINLTNTSKADYVIGSSLMRIAKLEGLK